MRLSGAARNMFKYLMKQGLLAEEARIELDKPLKTPNGQQKKKKRSRKAVVPQCPPIAPPDKVYHYLVSLAPEIFIQSIAKEYPLYLLRYFYRPTQFFSGVFVFNFQLLHASRLGLSAAGLDQSPPEAVTIRPEGGDFFIPPYRLIYIFFWCLHLSCSGSLILPSVISRAVVKTALFRCLAGYQSALRSVDIFKTDTFVAIPWEKNVMSINDIWLPLAKVGVCSSLGVTMVRVFIHLTRNSPLASVKPAFQRVDLALKFSAKIILDTCFWFSYL
ncbi:hypothetical protein JTB14_037835 [Gonioctena quinquepunctata]|nr:hypothetical protein JTB14_037835 [Gonioctena quinquepunctata]